MADLKMFDLKGKVALITGGCSGLGIVFGEALAEAGADIALADLLVGTPQGDEAVAAISKVGTNVRAYKCNVTDPASVDDMVAGAAKDFGKIDILVNSAGIFGENKRVWEMLPENWEKVLAVDLKGTFLCCRAVARLMVEQKSGKIINIASASSFKPLIGMSAYSAAKAGVVMLTKTLALELARYNVQANTLSPGYFITPLNKDFFDSEAGKKMISMWPPRRPGNLDELRGIIVYLASPASSYTTGTEMVIDGGQWL
ncbi:MAG: SDR family oxidoreductase [Dehalococcoidia bacterium]|nr:MAG: SDR family oxidoreductase [Dehalococcoidia bacterium]